MAISFFNEDIEKPALNENLISLWIEQIIKKYNRRVGEINYIFCSDNYLIEINRQYLEHDYYTDIITFDYTEENTISGDVFISVDRVIENSLFFKEGFDNELKRVISHGVLHLIGIKDKTEVEKREMRDAEDKCIMLINEIEKGLV